MSKTLSMAKHQLQLLSDSYDKHEMHSRRKVLLVHGLPEEATEQVESKISDLIHNQLKLPSFEQANIDVCHRLGVKADKRRPILIRFSNLKAKIAVWNAKTALKGSGITITEFLNKPRQEAFVAARKHVGIKSCWSADGVIVIALPNKSRAKIVSSSELQSLIAKHPKPFEDQKTASRPHRALRK